MDSTSSKLLQMACLYHGTSGAHNLFLIFLLNAAALLDVYMYVNLYHIMYVSRFKKCPLLVWNHTGIHHVPLSDTQGLLTILTINPRRPTQPLDMLLRLCMSQQHTAQLLKVPSFAVKEPGCTPPFVCTTSQCTGNHENPYVVFMWAFLPLINESESDSGSRSFRVTMPTTWL